MNANTTVRLLLMMLLFGVLLPLPIRAAEIAGSVLLLNGQVEIERGEQRLPATRQAELYSGDTIVVGEVGQVQLRFTDSTLLTLYPKTRFAVNDYRYGQGEGDRAQFSLVNGLMHTLTGQMDKKSYLLKTRLANLGVRGTEYSVRLDDILHLNVDAGSVAISNSSGTMLVHAGGSAVVTHANAMPHPGGSKINLKGVTQPLPVGGRAVATPLNSGSASSPPPPLATQVLRRELPPPQPQNNSQPVLLPPPPAGGTPPPAGGTTSPVGTGSVPLLPPVPSTTAPAAATPPSGGTTQPPAVSGSTRPQGAALPSAR